MTPRERYETAGRLLNEYDRTGDPDLFEQAAAHVGAAELHLALYHRDEEVSGVCTV